MIRTMAKTAGLAVVLAALPMAAHAEDAQFPKTMQWTSYDLSPIHTGTFRPSYA